MCTVIADSLRLGHQQFFRTVLGVVDIPISRFHKDDFGRYVAAFPTDTRLEAVTLAVG